MIKIQILFVIQEDYYKCISNNIISKKRLNKLQNVNIEELDVIKKLLVNDKKSAYQENNKERIIKTIDDIVLNDKLL